MFHLVFPTFYHEFCVRGTKLALVDKGFNLQSGLPESNLQIVHKFCR